MLGASRPLIANERPNVHNIMVKNVENAAVVAINTRVFLFLEQNCKYFQDKPYS